MLALGMTLTTIRALALDVDGLKLGVTACKKAIATVYAPSRAACTGFRFPENLSSEERKSTTASSFCLDRVATAEARAEARRAEEGTECRPPAIGLNPFFRVAFGWESVQPDEAPRPEEGACPYTRTFNELVYHPDELLSVEIACAGDRVSFYGKSVEEPFKNLRARLVARYGKPAREWTTPRRLPLPNGRENVQVNVLFSPKKGGGFILLVNLASSGTRRHALAVDGRDEAPAAPEDDEEDALVHSSDSSVLYYDDAYLKVQRRNFGARRDWLARRAAALDPAPALAAETRANPYKDLTTSDKNMK